MQFWKPNYLEGSEKKKQDSTDIDDHPDVQFPVHFFFLGCSVSKCRCSSRFASISVRNLHPFCWGFAITWQFVSTLGWIVVSTLSVQIQFSVAVTKNEIKEAAWDFWLWGHSWKKTTCTAVLSLCISTPWLCSSLLLVIFILEKLTWKQPKHRGRLHYRICMCYGTNVILIQLWLVEVEGRTCTLLAGVRSLVFLQPLQIPPDHCAVSPQVSGGPPNALRFSMHWLIGERGQCLSPPPCLRQCHPPWPHQWTATATTLDGIVTLLQQLIQQIFQWN